MARSGSFHSWLNRKRQASCCCLGSCELFERDFTKPDSLRSIAEHPWHTTRLRYCTVANPDQKKVNAK